MFTLDFVTPEQKIVFGQELEEITIPANRGELNILPGHAPLMTTLLPGQLKYKLKSGEQKTVAITWGYAQVSQTGVHVLAEAVIDPAQDSRGSLQAMKLLEDRLLSESLNDEDWDLAQLEMMKLRVELELSNSKTRH